MRQELGIEHTLDDVLFTKAMASLSLDEDDQLIAQWIVNFLQA